MSSDIRITGKLAISQLMAELQSDFSGGPREFDNQPGFGYGIEISKQLSANWEIGAEFLMATLKGEAASPDFSAIGYHHSMMTPITDPVEYKSQLFSKKIFVQYNFILNSHKNNTNPFIRAGIGVLPYKSELRYKDDRSDAIIFGKKVGDYEESKVSTAVYTLCPGIRTKVSSGVEFMAAVNLNMVNYDFLDVVHNYDEKGNRLDLKGIYADVMVGIILLINDSGRFDVVSKRKGRKTGNRAYLPFYNGK